MIANFNTTIRGNYIGGKFQIPIDPNGEWESISPANLKQVLGRFTYSYSDIDRAVQSAKDAFLSWRKKSIEERALLFKSFQEVFKRRQEELAQVICCEVGKPLWETKTEISSVLNKIDITLNEGIQLVNPKIIPNIMENVHGSYRYRPHGVMVVIGPFNFPCHLPLGHIVPALVLGNTVVFKPSEKTPLSGQVLAEIFDEAGFPGGTFNLMQGEKEVGRRLCIHEGVDGILFTGSYEVGTRIKQDTLQQGWKILALEMGGKNPVIIWKDADFEGALFETFFGAYVTTGQRCASTSRVIIHESLLERFLSRFHERAKAFTIDHPFENPFMGPLIDSVVVDRYLKFMGIASREGCEIVMRGKQLKLQYSGHYVSPSVCWLKKPTLENIKKSVYQQTELFAPNIAVMGTDDLNEAIAFANATQYGLVASVFTKDRKIYEKCFDELQMGLINWNKSTVGASSRLPFGGVKKSGNHFPAALFSSYYCAYPVSSLETEAPQANPKQILGLNWEK